MYVNNVGPFEHPDLKSLEYSSTNPSGGAYNFLSSVDKRVLDRPEFRRVHEVVMKEVNAYARQLLCVSDRIEFYVTDSWVNLQRRGPSGGAYVHHNSLISGCSICTPRIRPEISSFTATCSAWFHFHRRSISI